MWHSWGVGSNNAVRLWRIPVFAAALAGISLLLFAVSRPMVLKQFGFQYTGIFFGYNMVNNKLIVSYCETINNVNLCID